MYPRSGASGTSSIPQHHLSSAVSLHMSMSQRSSSTRYPNEQSKLNQSVPVPGQKSDVNIIYTFPDTSNNQKMPYLIKIDDCTGPLTLKDVKDRCPRKGQQYRYFFKTSFDGMEVFEEKIDDLANVPFFNGCKIFVECRGSEC